MNTRKGEARQLIKEHIATQQYMVNLRTQQTMDEQGPVNSTLTQMLLTARWRLEAWNEAGKMLEDPQLLKQRQEEWLEFFNEQYSDKDGQVQAYVDCEYFTALAAEETGYLDGKAVRFSSGIGAWVVMPREGAGDRVELLWQGQSIITWITPTGWNPERKALYRNLRKNAMNPAQARISAEEALEDPRPGRGPVAGGEVRGPVIPGRGPTGPKRPWR